MTPSRDPGEARSAGASDIPTPPIGEVDSPFASEPEVPAPAPAPGGWLAGWRLSSKRMGLLALSSALATGLVIWAGFARDNESGRLAAAVAEHSRMLASAAAAAAAGPAPAASSLQSPLGEAGGAEAAPSPPAGAEAGEAAPPTAPAASAPVPAQPPVSEQLTSPSPSAPSPAPGTPTAGATQPAAKIKHVFVITLTSPGYEQTWGPGSVAPYLTTQLRPKGTLLSSYYGIAHLDLPNYIAMISGQPPNAQTAADCPTFASFPAGSKADAQGRVEAPGCLYPLSVLTLGDQLTSTRRQWRGYIEDLANGPKPVPSCRHPSTDQPDETQHARPGDAYAARHNPFVYFHSLLDLGDCASDDVPLTQLAPDLATPAATPNYAFIAPNLCHDGSEAPCLDGSPGGLRSADAFLAEWVPKILASPAYQQDGLLVITFSDGPASDTSGCCVAAAPGAPAAPGGGRVGALLLSRYVTPGGESATPYNHYSLLRTIEDIFALSHLANAGQAGVRSFADDVLKSAFPSTRSTATRRR